MIVKFAQSCPTLRPHGLYSRWNSPGQNAGVGSLSLLQGIFPTRGLSPGLPHCRWILTDENPSSLSLSLTDETTGIKKINGICKAWSGHQAGKGRVA